MDIKLPKPVKIQLKNEQQIYVIWGVFVAFKLWSKNVLPEAPTTSELKSLPTTSEDGLDLCLQNISF